MSKDQRKEKPCNNPDCPAGTIPQPFGAFYKHKTNADGRQGSCKVCYKAKAAVRKLEKEEDPYRAYIFQ